MISLTTTATPPTLVLRGALAVTVMAPVLKDFTIFVPIRVVSPTTPATLMPVIFDAFAFTVILPVFEQESIPLLLSPMTPTIFASVANPSAAFSIVQMIAPVFLQFLTAFFP